MSEAKTLTAGTPPDTPISDRGYVQACLDLANNPSEFADETVSELEPAPDAGLINCYLTIMHFEEVNWTLKIHEAFARQYRSDARELRRLLRQTLEEAIDGIPAARRRRRTRVDVMLDGVVVETELQLLRSGRLEHLHRYVPNDHEAALALLWVFLLDPDRPFGQEVRICDLERCAKYFLAEKNPKGGRRRKYCSHAHTLEADALKAVDRNAKARKRLKK